MTKLRQDALKYPVYHILIVTLLAVGFVSLPVGKIFSLFISDEFLANITGGMLLRIILGTVAIIVISKYGFMKQYTHKIGLISFLLVLPAVLVAVNNFPIIGLATGSVTITKTAGQTALYVLYCLSVSYFEESVFCGIIFPLSYYILRDKKNNVFWAVAMTSAIFSCSHLVNLFSGAIGATFLQVGYTFLIGAMCCICKCITENIITAIGIHFIYDVGGLMTSEIIGIATGNRWDMTTMIITAIMGVIVCIYMVIMLLKVNSREIKCLYCFDKMDEKKENDNNGQV